jgi:hypothetical protein
MEQGKERRIRNHGKIHETCRRYNIKKEGAYLEKHEQPSGTQHTQCPKRQIFSSKPAKGKHEKENSRNKKSKPQDAELTSSGEPTGRWVSREVLTVVAFFRRLEAQEEVPFLTGASGDFTTTVAS